ncbi:MAG: DegT/DnrJ/EryC1/StrS family aminotransferase [Desulfovibrio sp.]|jgi:dTDP-4-amino-4,6-dideoxygalactose transaminase|nr:DegT/DnrJ/EryC1/StrS family aminotransferase [Desulfovibrio sp.]
MKQAIQVTRALAPDAEEYARHLEEVLASGQLTNHGPCMSRLEKELRQRLGVPHLALCANGTLALQLALHAAGLAGKEVITTPFSYAATVTALLWCGCRPVFADVDEETLCLDPRLAAEKIGPDTAGLLPVHIYGNACDVDAFGEIARAARLVVLYDAAQCFGGEFRGRSLLDYGDFAACSFHATKVFHTVEGGCVVARDPEGMDALGLLRACGHRGDTHFRLGVNAKMSEMHAAMGLCLLDKVAGSMAGRKRVSAVYDALLPERGLRRPLLRSGLDYNFAYYPVIFEDEKTALRVMERLNRENIFPRRYFYPALNTLPYLPAYQSCPVAESVSNRVLCLPLYAELEEADVGRIARIVRETL